MLGGRSLQVLTFVAGGEGVGRSVTVANLGVALARLGKEVLIIDEHSSRDDIASAFGLLVRQDLLQVIEQAVSLDHVLLQPMPGLRVLPAAHAVKKLGRLTAVQQQRLLGAMSSLERPVDVILVDACMDHPAGFSPFGVVAQEVVVVLAGHGESIMEAYTLIKRVSHAFARKHFRILVNKVKTIQEARSIFDNIARVSAQRGVAALDYAGAIPLDEALRQAAAFCRPVLVQSPNAPSANAFRDIAADLPYWLGREDRENGDVEALMPVSYTHLTLPTKRIV